MAVWKPCVLQRLSTGLPDGAAEELCGDAGADAGREGLPGDWLLTPEGMAELPYQNWKRKSDTDVWGLLSYSSVVW